MSLHLPADMLLPDYSKSICALPGTIASSYNTTHSLPTLPPIGGSTLWERPIKILFILDGFGHDHVQRYRGDLGQLERIVQASHYAVLHSTIFSSTPVALWALHTGQYPAQGRVTEFGMYHPKVGMLIQPMAYMREEDRQRDKLIKDGILVPEDLYAGQTVYELLASQSIPSTTFVPQKYFTGPTQPSWFTAQSLRGSDMLGYDSQSALISQFVHQLSSQTGIGYVVVYLSQIDSTGHQYGPNTSEHFGAAATVLNTLWLSLTGLPSRIRQQAAAMVVADHGMVSLPHKNLIRLDQEAHELWQYLAPGGKVPLILPTGAPMGLTIHVRPDTVSSARQLLQHKLGQQAWIISTEEALQHKLFGPIEPNEVNPDFRAALGQLLVLAHPNHFIWRGPFGQRGIHGGLDQRVIEVPFLIFDPDTL